MNNFSVNKIPEKLIILFLFLSILVLVTARAVNFYNNQITFSDILITIVSAFNFGLCIFAIRESLITRYLTKEINYQKENSQAMNDALKEIRSERHEFINHLQSLQGYLLLGEHREAINYLKDVGADCRFNSQILSIPIPSLKAFLLSKKSLTDKEKIEFKLKIESKLESLKIRPSDITTIFGNLIDNAVEALKKTENGSREIVFYIYETEKFYHFEIKDSALPVDDNEVGDIFKLGYSTKGSNRGYGLALVKKTVDKYEGNITYDSNTKSFTVSLPKRDDDI